MAAKYYCRKCGYHSPSISSLTSHNCRNGGMCEPFHDHVQFIECDVVKKLDCRFNVCEVENPRGAFKEVIDKIKKEHPWYKKDSSKEAQ